MTTPRRPPVRGLLLSALALLALVAVAVGALGLRQHRDPVAVVLEPAIKTPQELFGKDDVRMLIVGLDYDYDAKDQETSAHSRSDIIMAVRFDVPHRRVYELSVPRDMVATLPDGSEGKINEAQSDGGIAESQTVVAQWLGLPGFDRYVVLRINTSKDLIDALGGIDLTVQNSDALMHQGPNGPLDYDDTWGHLHVHLVPGFQHLDGEHAVAYARFRHDWCSDPCRIRRQQQVMRAIVERLKRHRVDTVLHLGALLDVMRKDVQTNLTPQEELSLAFAYRDASANAVTAAQVPYVRTVDLPRYGDALVADDDAKARLVREMLVPATAEQP